MPERQDDVLKIRLPEGLKEQARRAAEASGLTLSEWVRRELRAGVQIDLKDRETD